MIWTDPPRHFISLSWQLKVRTRTCNKQSRWKSIWKEEEIRRQTTPLLLLNKTKSQWSLVWLSVSTERKKERINKWSWWLDSSQGRSKKKLKQRSEAKKRCTLKLYIKISRRMINTISVQPSQKYVSYNLTAWGHQRKSYMRKRWLSPVLPDEEKERSNFEVSMENGDGWSDQRSHVFTRKRKTCILSRWADDFEDRIVDIVGLWGSEWKRDTVLFYLHSPRGAGRIDYKWRPRISGKNFYTSD